MAAPTALFDSNNDRLTVSFLNLSTGSIDNYDWDFGDGSEHSVDKNPVHTYGEPGFYLVTLNASTGDDPPEIGSFNRNVGVSTYAGECTQTPTYDSVLTRIPESFQEVVSQITILSLIKKWQTYLGDLIYPIIPSQYIHNELYWPLLANELVIELVILDIFEGNVKNYLMSLVTSQTGSSSSSSSSTGQNLKRVITGPSEAEWYNTAESASQQLSSITKPGGFIEQSKNQACLLAGKLGVPLQICPDLNKPVFPMTIAKKPTRHHHHGRSS